MTRVTVPVGEDIGFLPGTEEEKMNPWMGALEDNLDVLNKTDDEAGEWGRAATRDLIRSRIKVKSLNFMRGRTFINKFLIIDEAQNLTPKQMKTLITRAGPGTKVVCLGNIAQGQAEYARRDGQRVVVGLDDAVHDTDHRLPENDDDEQRQPLDERLGRLEELERAAVPTKPTLPSADPADDHAPTRRRADRASGSQAEATITAIVTAGRAGTAWSRRGAPAGRGGAPRTTARTAGQEHGVGQGERGAVDAACVSREDRQDGEDGHLGEDVRAAPAVLTAVQLVVERAVDPGDPDQPEDSRELGDASPPGCSARVWAACPTSTTKTRS